MGRSAYQLVGDDPFWGNEVPASSDPVWAQFGEVVLDVLHEPRTVGELKSWARKEKFQIAKLYNTLSWLGMRGLVLFDKTSGEPIWKRTDVEVTENLEPILTKTLQAAPKNCRRCGGLMKTEPTRFACVACGHSVYPPPDLDEPDDDLSFP